MTKSLIYKRNDKKHDRNSCHGSGNMQDTVMNSLYLFDNDFKIVRPQRSRTTKKHLNKTQTFLKWVRLMLRVSNKEDAIYLDDIWNYKQTLRQEIHVRDIFH